jgi:hypothetical protein
MSGALGVPNPVRGLLFDVAGVLTQCGADVVVGDLVELAGRP